MLANDPWAIFPLPHLLTAVPCLEGRVLTKFSPPVEEGMIPTGPPLALGPIAVAWSAAMVVTPLIGGLIAGLT